MILKIAKIKTESKISINFDFLETRKFIPESTPDIIIMANLNGDQ